MLQKIWYTAFRAYVRTALSVFYKKFQKQGLDNIPQDEPVILVGNHQNAFLDALVAGTPLKKHVHFLTRATIFQKKIAAKFFGSLNMMPVYRMRDGYSTLSKNDVIIERSVNLMKAKSPLLIFPEGIQYMRRFMRPLKKGAARIAFTAEQENDFKLNVKIVPFGIHYENHSGFRQNLLIKYGKPIAVADYREIFLENPAKAVNLLNEEILKQIEKLSLIIERDNYELIEKRWLQCRKVYPDLDKTLQEDQKLVSSIEQEVKKDTQAVSHKAEKHPDHKLSGFRRWLLAGLGLPFYLYGALNHLIPYQIIHYILKNKISDPHWYGSIKFAGGMFLVPIFYLIQSLLVWNLTDNGILSLAYVVSLPLSGLFAHTYQEKIIRRKGPLSAAVSRFELGDVPVK